VETGSNTGIPPDLADLNNNGDTDEPCPFDVLMLPRVVGVVVDMGAYEYQDITSTCPWDLDGDGLVGITDFLALLGQWGTCGSADFDGDGEVGINDFLELLGNWGPCS
jgi:hypothetical protein